MHHVTIEPVGGELTDHYDPRGKVLRLSQGVFGSNSCAAVGIAAHEAGHALQDAHQYAPLVVRNFAVPIANFGGSVTPGSAPSVRGSVMTPVSAEAAATTDEHR